jgi:enoyl-CoA hydratase
VASGEALDEALGLAEQIARFPQLGLRADRHAVLEQWSLGEEAALRSEWERARAAFEHAEMQIGAARFASGLGRRGDFGRI